MTKTAFAPGKIILSGEYAVVFGFPGIAVPSSMGMTATFEQKLSLNFLQIEWQGIDERWKKYLGMIISECAKHHGDVFCGILTIKNQLPLGRGMGSSTALVIAVCRALLGDDCENVAHQIEDHVNPGNSGLDFAVIWNGKPVSFTRGKPPSTLSLNLNFLQNSVLIDTGMPGESTPELVSWMKSQQSTVKTQLERIGRCTERLIGGESPMTVFRDHHQAQVALGVVPERVQDLIREIERNEGSAKVIGAGGRTGGAGMVLALHKHTAIVEKLAEKFTMPVL